MSDIVQEAMKGHGHEYGEGDDRRVIGYMCQVDWDHELGCASDGNKVYPSVDAIRRCRLCVENCGIVAVEVRFVCVVAEGTDP